MNTYLVLSNLNDNRDSFLVITNNSPNYSGLSFKQNNTTFSLTI